MTIAVDLGRKATKTNKIIVAFVIVAFPDHTHYSLVIFTWFLMGAQWLSGRVLDSRPKGRGFEPHRRHCVVLLEQDTFILA